MMIQSEFIVFFHVDSKQLIIEQFCSSGGRPPRRIESL